MDYVRLGATGLEVSRICLGCMSYGEPGRGNHEWTLDEESSRPLHPAGARGRHQLLRHGQRLLGRQQRGDRRAGAGRFRPARRGRARDQGAHADAPGPERRRAVAQGDHARDRREPAPARHRLRRPLPDPPLGLPHADRGDARGAARRREGRQGPLHRRFLDVRVAVQQGALHRRRARLDPVRQHAGPLQPAATARRSARCCRSAPIRASASSRGARSPAAG